MSAPLAPPRVRPVVALFVRDALIARSYRATYVLELASALLSISIYFFISRTFRDASPGELAGASSYFEFALVGAVLSLLVQSAVVGIGRRLRE